MPDAAVEPPTLHQRETRLDGLEFALSLQDAELRYTEQLVAAKRQALGERAAALDARERQIALAVAQQSGQLPHEWATPGSGNSLNDVDVDGTVAAAAGLHVGRAGLLTARQEAYDRRAKACAARRTEVLALDAGLQAAAERLLAREQQCAAAALNLITGVDATDLPADPPVLLRDALLRPPEHWTSLPTPLSATPTQARQAVAGLGQMPRVSGPVTTGWSATVAPADTPARVKAKRITTTPLFRPAELPPMPTPSRVILPVPPQPNEAVPLVESLADEAPPQPYARVWVDSSPESVARHADTVAVDSDASVAIALATKSRKRRRDGPPLRLGDTLSLPIDLPDSVPVPHLHHRSLTAPFLATLLLHGNHVIRRAISFDRGRQLLMISLLASGEALPQQCELIWRDRDGTGHTFAIALRQVMPSGPTGKLAVLSTESWTEGDYAAMQTVLDRLS